MTHYNGERITASEEKELKEIENFEPLTVFMTDTKNKFPSNELEDFMRNNSDENESLILSDYSSNSFDSSHLVNEQNQLNFACANARLIVEKIDSLITLMEESSLHFIILTETWLTPRHCPPRAMADLTIGSNLSFIRRDRGTRGGVAIAYDPTKL